MSFDLAVWNTDKPMSNGQAIEVYGNICEENDVSSWLTEHVRIKHFVTDLTTDYPQIDDLTDEQIDDCPWSCAFDCGPSWVLMSIVWSRSDEMAKFIFRLSQKYGLAFFDPQTELICLPKEVVNTASVTLTCPWLHGQIPASRELIADLIPFLAHKDDPFIVLEADDEVYMQTLWTKDGYLLEYRAGNERKHFRAKDNLSESLVIDTLTDYAMRGNKWLKMHKYSRVKL